MSGLVDTFTHFAQSAQETLHTFAEERAIMLAFTHAARDAARGGLHDGLKYGPDEILTGARVAGAFSLGNALTDILVARDPEKYQKQFESSDTILVRAAPSQIANAINFRTINDGTADFSVNNSYNNYSLTYHANADDPLNDAIATIETNTMIRLSQSATAQQLMGKQSWSLTDREDWESELSQIIAEETHKIPGLSEYRSYYKDGKAHDDAAQFPTPRLNDLSYDIVNGTNVMEFDCDLMSYLKGSIQQKLEDHILPAPQGDAVDYKNARPYFLYIMQVATPDDEIINHAVIVSPATGRVVEATSDPTVERSYQKTGHDFVALMRGKPFMVDSDVYGGALTPEIVEGARQDKARELMLQARLDMIEFTKQLEDYAADPMVIEANKAKEALNDQPGSEPLKEMIADMDQDIAGRYPLMEFIFEERILPAYESIAALGNPETLKAAGRQFTDDMAAVKPLMDRNFGLTYLEGEWESGQLSTMAGSYRSSFADIAEGLQPPQPAKASITSTPAPP